MALDETIADYPDPTLPLKIEQMRMYYERLNEIFAMTPYQRQASYGRKIVKRDLINERQSVLLWIRNNEINQTT